MVPSPAEHAEVLRRVARGLGGVGGTALLAELERLGLSLRLSDEPFPVEVEQEAVVMTAPGRLRVHVLGGLRLEVDGRAVDLSRLRPLHRELLAALAMSAGTVVQRDTLVSWFWPDSLAARAQHSLQVGVSEIRRLLDRAGARNTLQRIGTGYELGITDPADCDARGVEQLLRSAAVAARREDRERSATCLESAIRIAAGDLLPEFGYPEWILAERDRLRQLIGDACESLAELRFDGGRFRDAADAARAGLSHDRDRDTLWRLRIRALQRLGEPAAAAAAQRRYDGMLDDLDAADHRTVNPRLRSVG